MKITIALPTYNEEEIIQETLTTLSSVLSKFPKGITWEIVVADNGSTDSTKEKVKEIHLPGVRIFQTEIKGKGAGIIGAAMDTDADYFGFIDADLSADPDSIIPMLEILRSEKVDIVIGSRHMDYAKVNRGIFRTATSKIFNYLQRLILGLKIKDTQCGLKIMNRQGIIALRQCKEKTWFFDIELLCIAQYNNLLIEEFPVCWEEFRYKDRKTKLRLMRDGVAAIIAMFKIRNNVNKKKI